MSTPQTSVGYPTKAVYVDDGGRPMTFTWRRRMPQNGFLGDVTYDAFHRKPIQVFDARQDTTDPANPGTIWTFQAQDGSFLYSMKVGDDLSYVSFADRKKGNWPLVIGYSGQ